MNKDEDEALARAWALKAACYEAWHSEPRRTRDAANELALLAGQESHPTVAALVSWTDGIALLAEGHLIDGLARLEQAQYLFEEQGDRQHAAQTQVPQMVALSFLGRESEVVDRAHQALATFVAAGDFSSAGKIEVNLGTSLARQDRYAEAEVMYRSAAERFGSSDNVELLLMASIGLANALTWQFRLDEAFLVAAQAQCQARDSGHVILHAQTLEAIGLIELNRGRWAETLAALAKALQILDEAGASPQRRLECEIALAGAYTAVNLLGEALRLYQRIIDEAHALPDPNEEALATLQLARVLARNGQYHAALTGLLRAREQYAALGNSSSLALTRLCEARVELALGHSERALQIAVDVSQPLRDCGFRGWWLEARLVQAGGLARSGSLVQARRIYEAVVKEAEDLRQVEFECRAGLGHVLLVQEEFEAARQQFEMALQSIDAEREALPADEMRSAIGSEAREVHEALTGIALARGDPVDAFTNMERGRARAMARGLGNAARGKPPAPQAQTLGRLNRLRRAWREAMLKNDGTRLAVLDGEMCDIEHALLEEQRRADLCNGNCACRPAQLSGPATLDIPSLQSRLGPGRAMVVYYRHGTEWMAVVVTNREVTLQSLPSTDIVERVASLRFQIESVRNPIVAQQHGLLLRQRLISHARALYEQLWGPIQRLLERHNTVVIVPHGALHDLPFGLLHDGCNWLVETHALSAAPSAAVWLALTSTAALEGALGVLAVGVPRPDLLHVEREIGAIAKVFGSATTVLYGEHATAASVRRAATSGSTVMHFACHGSFRADNPAFSHLALADGPLPLHELARWNLRIPLVVLSACHTGVSKVAPGEEALGLVRAVLLAGAASVVATQWGVDDEATADLIQAFYLGLHAGDSPAVALQRAQSGAAQRGVHPYFWGAFAVYGVG